jgi:secreted PhoX family phosphatase
MIRLDRRRFIGTSSAFAALIASGCTARGNLGGGAGFTGYGALVPDPQGVLDLPQGFSYRVISRLGDAMNDGGTVPDNADGMGAFALPGGKIALVRNHELMPDQDGGGAVGPAYDTVARSLIPLPGGTTNVVLDARTLTVERQFRSLAGTIRNCAGGITPWGTWLTCEENTSRADGRINRDHGYVFEVPAAATAQVNPAPLVALGRFNHEAAAVDPATGIVYQTEDRGDGLLYRFTPKVPGRLAEGGKLQALAVDGLADSRNHDGVTFAPGAWRGVRWVDLDHPEAPDDDLRRRGAAAGALLFARGEGIHMGEGELYFACTSGGAAKLGQVFRLVPGRRGKADRLQLFFESTSVDQFNYGDNLTVAPSGHLIVCEDQYTDVVDNYLRGITPQGNAYPFGRLRLQTELAGACYSPDGKVLFVNAYRPALTLAITGPWA